MAKTWLLRADYLIEAQTEEEVWDKWAKNDAMYDSVYSIEPYMDDDEEDE